MKFHVLRLAGEGRALRNSAIITHLCKSRVLLCFTTSGTENLLTRGTSKLTAFLGSVLHKTFKITFICCNPYHVGKKMESSHNSLELFDMYHLFSLPTSQKKMATIVS